MDLRYVAFARADPSYYDRIRTATRPHSPPNQHFTPDRSVDSSLWRPGPLGGRCDCPSPEVPNEGTKAAEQIPLVKIQNVN